MTRSSPPPADERRRTPGGPGPPRSASRSWATRRSCSSFPASASSPTRSCGRASGRSSATAPTRTRRPRGRCRAHLARPPGSFRPTIARGAARRANDRAASRARVRARPGEPPAGARGGGGRDDRRGRRDRPGRSRAPLGLAGGASRPSDRLCDRRRATCLLRRGHGPIRRAGEGRRCCRLALLPVWTWGPHLGPGHLGPRSAAEVARSLGPAAVVPIHWGTLYPRQLHRVWKRALREPGDRFATHVRDVAPDVDVRVLDPGSSTWFDLRRR